ncbi:MAG: mechanosensitive ion channel [Nanoarchaeota archaeon]|nr:mechanosensitive ion channel [Nanoarchaeota archaeon]MBU0977203.1 mechanosensitive ion channel [Nanoarchaeota archaeon]
MIMEFFPWIAQYLPNQYFRAVIVLLVLFIVFRLLLALFQKFFMKLASKTKTDVDDILLEKSAAPLNFMAFILSVRFAIEELVLSESTALNSERVIYSLLVISIGYLIFTFVNIALVFAWRNLARKTKVKVNESVTGLVHETLRVMLIILVLLYILDIWGVEIVPVLGALGVAGLAVALALQPVLSNIFSGISVVMDKSVKVGDWIIMDNGTWGVISKIGIRSTRVKTFDNDMVIIPNTKLADSDIRNVSLPEPKVRKTIPFGVAYGSNVDEVKKIVLAELKKIKHVVKNPEPYVRFLEMGESSLNFKAFFYIDSYENGYASVDEANTRIYNALNKAEITIPFPQMDVHLKKD